MRFSSSTLIRGGKRPLHAATRVLNASTSASSVLARCWVHGSARTTALIRTVRNEGLRRAYSAKSSGPTPKSDPGMGYETKTERLPLFRRLMNAWVETPTKWYPIPIAVGALLLVAIQYRRTYIKSSKEADLNGDGQEVIKLRGPWQVHVLGALPLRNMSRLWGYCNSLELPIWFRPFGFKLYAVIFGCNLEEIENEDLTSYASLGEFFYRRLKDGVRPVADAPLVSPADGRILHFGTIKDLRVEQVKGITYSLDALLGVDSPSSFTPTSIPTPSNRDHTIVDDQEFANVNGIEYSLDQLLGSGTSGTGSPNPEKAPPPTKHGDRTDESVPPATSDLPETLVHDASVAMEVKPSLSRKGSLGAGRQLKDGNALYFTVIYLAPGDYHRFHSPTAWVVEKRRHFVGELFSVSPYIAKRLENLFVLNERVALLGRWKHGFFGMVPVGATNVGSIKINFDQALRTNERRKGSKPPPGTYTEAVYSAASPILNGQPLLPAQEMGGFCLGSTIVLVFEAPKDFQFAGRAGDKVKVGEALGYVGGVKKVKKE